MSYSGYVAAAYAVFAAVLLWDILVPALRIRRTLRDARLRARRAAARRAGAAEASTELTR